MFAQRSAGRRWQPVWQQGQQPLASTPEPFNKRLKMDEIGSGGETNPRVRPGGETAETKEQAMKIEEPKKPPSSWNLFLAEKNRKEAVITLAAQVWNALPDSAKKPFEDKASEMKKKYAEDMRAFLSAGGTKKSRARNSNESDGSKVEKRIRTNRVDVQKAGA